jgi:beta-lactamase superfamily II metal-dependent hydrolase
MATRYISAVGAFLLPRRMNTSDPAAASGSRQMLLGQRVEADVDGAVDGWTPIALEPSDVRWIRTEQLSERQQLKVFYTDVGQGDAILIEAEDTMVIIDGGPNRGLHDELRKRDTRRRELDVLAGTISEPAVIHAVVVSHFDKDHYAGLTAVLKDEAFRVERLFHNGLPRYGDPADRDLNLGTASMHTAGSEHITTDLDDIESARRLLASGDLNTKAGNPNDFAEFLQAAMDAHDATPSRLGRMERLARRDTTVPAPTLPGVGTDTAFEVLAPVPTTTSGRIRLPVFSDPHKNSSTGSESHTINGNSVVLRLTYGDHTFLFGGDLNQPAQRYLRDRYPDMGEFKADVNKACHHGSSDFELAYVKAVAAHATVFSSGDSGTYDHPLPDAMGAAARHGRGEFPLVFSTELAREGTRHLGHINARSNGTELVVAQKKEKPSSKRSWIPFGVPNKGPFGSH